MEDIYGLNKSQEKRMNTLSYPSLHLFFHLAGIIHDDD